MGRTSSGLRRAVTAPDWIHAPAPDKTSVLHARMREGLLCVAERRGHRGLVVGLRLLADVQGFVVYAAGRPGHVTAHAAALWNVWQPAERDGVFMDLLDTCARMLEFGPAEYWADFLATVRGALVS